MSAPRMALIGGCLVFAAAVTGWIAFSAEQEHDHRGRRMTSHLIDVTQPDPRHVVAQALAVKEDAVRIQRISHKEGGREVVVQATVPDGEHERVKVTYNAETRFLRRVFWFDRTVSEPEDTRIPMEEALGQAKRLKARLFPPVPVKMQLVERARRDRPAYCTFAWQARAAPGVYTGDMVSVLISSITGEPISYVQRVAKVRPELEDIDVGRDRAMAIAREHLHGRYDSPVELSLDEPRLMLSSPIHPDEGSVWIVDFDVKPSGDRQPMGTMERA